MPLNRSTATDITARVVPAERPNTLGLGRRELHAILDYLDEVDEGAGNKRREYVRWPFRQVGVTVRFVQPGGTETSLRLAVRNLSRGGLSTLHNAFMHIGTRCTVELPRVAMGTQLVDGTIVRCQHRRGVLHEIGVKFKRPVNIRNFLAHADLYSIERVAPDLLTGRMLVVMNGELDRRVLQHFIRETCLKVDMVSSVEEAAARLAERYDLYVVDWSVPGGAGEFVRRVFEQRASPPIIVLTDNPVAIMDDGVLETQSVSLLKKPYEQEEFLRAVAERLLVTDATPAGDSKGALRLSPKQLLEIAAQLERAIEARDLVAAKNTARQIGGTAATFGLKQVAAVATWVAEAISKADSIETINTAIRQLAAACRQDARELELRAA